MNLLIVDDEILAIQGLVDDIPWEELQFDEVYTAASYAQAVNLLCTRQVDILLSDIEMPLKSGLELVKWAKEHNPEIQTILLTCHDDFQFAKEAIRLECVGYILKPADTMEVVETLQKAVRRVKERSLSRQGGRNEIQVKDRTSSPGEARADEELDHISRTHSAYALEKMENYIRLHLSENLSLDELASIAGMSTTHLSRLFKKKHDMTIVDYITEQRMRLAMQLLAEAGIPVSTAAMRCGFSNYSYFTKAFKKFTGKTPREYRQELN